MILEESLAGPLGVFVKFSTLQDYGVDKVFFLENDNADVSQRNVVFIARGESAKQAQSIAGMLTLLVVLRIPNYFAPHIETGELQTWLDGFLHLGGHF